MVNFLKNKLKAGFSSRQELEFFKLSIQALNKQTEIEEISKDWREKINPEDTGNEWLLYSVIESLQIEKDIKKVSFLSEIMKMQDNICG